MFKNDYDLIYWHTPEVISYHIIYHLCKYLGFEVLTFTPMKDSLFDPKTSDFFFRFHFRALPFRKMSSHVWDILLIDKALEPKYSSVFQSRNPRVAEALFEALKDSFAYLLLLKDENSKPAQITMDSIIAALKQNFGSMLGDALGQWENQDDIYHSIKVFNRRKQFFHERGYELFLKCCFENAYSCHFAQIKGITLNNALATNEDVQFLNIIYKDTKLHFNHEK